MSVYYFVCEKTHAQKTRVHALAELLQLAVTERTAQARAHTHWHAISHSFLVMANVFHELPHTALSPHMQHQRVCCSVQCDVVRVLDAGWPFLIYYFLQCLTNLTLH